MKISFIVPVYNVGEYLPRCLDSILAVKSVDWECILIDDGSTDNSLDIIRGYTEKYPERFIARHKENGGVSSARNMGLDLASGDRIMFVDPDDYLFPEADSFFEYIMKECCDMDYIRFGYLMVYSDGRSEDPITCRTDFTDPDEMIFNVILLGNRTTTCCTQLFKTEIVKKYNIKFDESMRLAEDHNFMLEYLKYVQSCVFKRNYVYAYYQRGGSAASKHSESDWSDHFKFIEKRFELIEYRKMKLNRRQLNDLYFFNFKYAVGRFIRVYSSLSLRGFKIKCKEILSIPVMNDIINKSRKYMPLYFCVKCKMYGLFWFIIRPIDLYLKLIHKKK